ncbi:hypothetical protein HanRHA438_Chr03g0101411 [Helianthus annuus]|nr:hypothetical protein HanRHA438_Chr03g0101411 [Helianthus annuus]
MMTSLDPGLTDRENGSILSSKSLSCGSPSIVAFMVMNLFVTSISKECGMIFNSI